MRSTDFSSSVGNGCESPATVRPLALGLAGFFLRPWRLGYSTPAPIEPRDEVAELQRQVVASLAGLESLTKRMEAAAARVNFRVDA